VQDSTVLPAANVSVQVTVQPETVTVGDHFTATVHVHLPADRVPLLRFPEPPDSTHFVSGVAPMMRRDSLQGGYVDAVATYTLAAWQTGRVELGLDSVIVGDVGVPLPDDSITVRSVLPADSAVRDTVSPKPPRALLAMSLLQRLTHPTEHPGVVVVLGLLVLIMLAGLVWWWRRRRGSPEPSSDWVEHAFQRIEAMRLLERGEPERHAILMTGVLRDYLVRTYAVVHASATTSELASALEREPQIPAQQVLHLFAQVDLLKFARADLQTAAAQAVGTDARTIVQAIRVQRETAAEESAGTRPPGGARSSETTAQREAA
jgi:hypothetical protein